MTTELWHLALVVASVVAVLMTVLWLVHLVISNAAIVDVGWAFGLACASIIYAVGGAGHPVRRGLVGTMVTIWGVRLGLHLLRDRVIGQPEEGRYVHLRQAWRGHVPAKFFLFFQAQGLLVVILSPPFLLAAFDPAPAPSAVDLAAATLWLVAVTGEAVADGQLARFRAHPSTHGQVCRQGLWRYSRHPNYFFEWLVWVAYALLATRAPWGWTAWLSPALILYFLFRVTGIPATEAQALRSKGEAYREYQRTTSAFVPCFPRNVRP